MTDQLNPLEKALFVSRLVGEIELYEKEYKHWLDNCKEIVDIYSLENVTVKNTNYKFNILWSNTQTLLPILMGNSPIPVVQRRHNENDPVSRVASQILERCLSFEIEKENWLESFRRVCLDNLLLGRGTPWIRYDYKQEEDQIKAQDSPLDYIFYQDFLHAPLRSWDEIKSYGWVARKVAMTEKQVENRFGEEKAALVNFVKKSDPDAGRDIDQENHDKSKRQEPTVNVYEMWHAGDKMVYWLCKELEDDLLDARADPYQLEDFLPCPEPFYGTINNNSLIPIPDYLQYSGQAQFLEQLHQRLRNIVDQLVVKGVVASTASGMELLLKARENELIVIDLVGQNAKISDMVEWMDLDPLINAGRAIVESINQVVNTIYEIIGIADISRGAVNPREKLGQSQLKSAATTNRINIRQKTLEITIRNCLRIKAEIIAELYTPQKILSMAKVESIPEIAALTQDKKSQLHLIQQALTLLKDGKNREFAIEVETNSTKTIDEAAEKEQTLEFLQTMGSFLKEAVPLASQTPSITPLVVEVMNYAVRNYHAGRSIEYKFQEIGEKLNKEAEQQPMMVEQLAQEMQKVAQSLTEQIQQNSEQISQITGFLKNAQQQPPIV